MFLVRHASAGDRSAWRGDDRDRPLDSAGHATAIALAGVLGGEPITVLLSSEHARCRQTLEPLGARLGVDVRDEPRLGEGAPAAEATALIRELASAGEFAALCSHGDVIPATIDHLVSEGMVVEGPHGSKKGSVWRLDTRGGAIVAGIYVKDPTRSGLNPPAGTPAHPGR